MRWYVRQWDKVPGGEQGERVPVAEMELEARTPKDAVEEAARLWNLPPWQWQKKCPKSCLRVAPTLAEAR